VTIVGNPGSDREHHREGQLLDEPEGGPVASFDRHDEADEEQHEHPGARDPAAARGHARLHDFVVPEHGAMLDRCGHGR
jgi:hypothetical protein